MPTTSNFGWTTPADTDLVKDGASAIRTLGNGIDTSLVDLKGGTTGQVLSKNSNTDMDFTWVAQDDSNAIQNAIVDAKGDLISATANDTPARLASSGVNGEVLTIDTSTSTGLKWATPATGGMTQLDTQTFTSSSTYTIPANAKLFVIDFYGAGSGGGGGRRASGTNAAGGGSGGAGGAYSRFVCAASEFSSPITYTIGAGGTGGAGATVDGTDGSPGNIGGQSRFGHLYFVGGLRGRAGSTSTSSGPAGYISPFTWVPFSNDQGFGKGGNGAGTGAGGGSGNYGLVGGGGGGGGAGASTGQAAGGTGGTTTTQPHSAIDTTNSNMSPLSGGGGAGGAAGGSAGTAGSAAGIAGGGGGSATAATGGAGGAGGSYAGGGGGGGASGSNNGGAGGAGGNALIKIWVFG